MQQINRILITLFRVPIEEVQGVAYNLDIPIKD